MQSLENRTVIVTGGSRGIGRILSLRLAKDKAKIVITGRNEEALENTTVEIKKYTDNVLAIKADVSVYDDVKKVVKESVNRFENIDYLINNAAIMTHKYLKDFNVEEWKKVLDVNVAGTFMMCKEVLPHMLKLSSTTGGTIVNVASMSGRHGYERGSAYSASKFALTGFAESIFKEVREFNIRVMTIYPSMVDTSFKEESSLKEIGKGVYMRAEDVADSILFAMKLPQRAMLKEIEIWGTNP
jgi:NADP-dependent 3-hydroxy acid dehydrogenase YdfG